MSDTEPINLGTDAKFSAAERLTEVYNNILQSAEEEIKIDAKRVYWVSPFTACWFAALYDQINLQGKVLKLTEPERDNAVHQWHNLGISKYLGFSRKIISRTNLPAFPVTRLTEPSYPLAGRVKEILTSRLKGAENFHKALHFAIRETVENAFEHGQTKHCYMCAYSVPTKNLVRLCILDTGIGIPNSMRSSQRYRIESNVEAVKLSSNYGISSKAEDRGIGLYILRDVVEKNEGILSILSGNALVDISKKIKGNELSFSFLGTIIKLTLKTRKEFYYIDVASWEEL